MKRAVLVLAAIVLAQMIATAAMACSVCVTYPLKEEFKRARRVFIGRAEAPPAHDSARFTVIEPFKGANAGEVVDVDTANSCHEHDFRPGITYLVFVDAEGGVPLCSHTAEAGAEHAREIERVRRRASWWRSRLSSVTMFRSWLRQPGNRVAP